jgi:hypothetical protein
MRRSARPAHFLAAVAAVIGLGSGCGDVSIPVTLALEQPSTISLELPTEQATTSLVGGVDTTIEADLGLLKLLGALVGKALPADIEVDEVLIAGTSISVFGGLFNTGTICLFQDPALPSEGSAAFNLLLGTAAFNMTLNASLAITDPALGGLLGGPQAFSQSIATVVPLSLSDLLGILGGGGGGLALTQEIDTVFGPVPLLGEIHVTGELTLASADAFPSDPLLDECDAYIASLP